jgi:hypothetical protein
MTSNEEINILRDALDHIARIANAARQQTRRLDWISMRAHEALRGIPWNHEYLPEPKKASMEEVHDLRGTILMLVNACESENLIVISAAVEEARIQHPSLLRKLADSPPTSGAGS